MTLLETSWIVSYIYIHEIIVYVFKNRNVDRFFFPSFFSGVLLNYCVDLQRKGPKAADDKLGGAKLPPKTDAIEPEIEPEAKCCKCCSFCDCCCRRFCFDQKKKNGNKNKVSPAADKKESLI